MAKKYDYSLKYVEKTDVKHRRCRFCKKMTDVVNLESKSCCSLCYVIIYDRKRCKQCLLRKTTNSFRKSKLYSDGYESKCSECKSLKKQKDKQKEYNKNYQLRKKGILPPLKDKVGINNKSYRKRSKEKQTLREKILTDNKEYKEKYWLAKKENQEKRAFLLKKSTLSLFKKETSKKIKEIKKNSKTMRADHIIPIIHNDVCGLNVPWNIQTLTKEENSYKSNRFDGTLENESWRIEFQKRRK